MKKVFLVFFLLFFLVSDVDAGKGEDGFYWWRVPEIVEKLDLTSSQTSQIEGIFQSHSVQIDNIDNELIKRENELKSMLYDPSAKNNEVKLLSKEVLRLKSNRKALKLDMLFGIRDILSVDQRKKLKQLKSKHK